MHLLKKLLGILLVRRPETRNRWWHRLALVLIYGSTIIIAIWLATVVIAEGTDNWVTESYTTYSFEHGYETAKGKEIDCRFSVLDWSFSPMPFFRCGDFSESTEFLEKYFRAQGTYEQLEAMRLPRGGYIPIAERQGKKTDEKIMVQLIKGGELNNIKVKRVAYFDYALFLGNWSIYILLVLAWIIFWEAIVYRTILYIVYGKSKIAQ